MAKMPKKKLPKPQKRYFMQNESKNFPCDGCPNPSACIKSGECLMEKL